jgi:glycosyltransferase involved in cell wall biosynthesis
MARRDRRPTVGYVLRKFPVLSETFILNEILGLEARGMKVQIFALAPGRDPRFHQGLSRLRASISYVPGFDNPRPLLQHASRAARRFGAPYRRVLARVLMSGRPSLFYRMLQAGWVAERAARMGIPRLHAHFATRATTVANLASAMSGIPYSFTAHAFDIYKTNARPRVLRRKIEAADFVITISEANRRFLEEIAGQARRKIVLLHNGIDLSRFAPNGRPDPSPFRILSVARLVEKKGLGVLIEACHELHKRELPFQCSIIGRGRMRPKLQELITRWDLKRNVKLLGARTQDEVLDEYHRSHLYVLPAVVGSDGNREGLPVSIVEALACGLPVISTPVAGIPEVVQHEQNGLLVGEHDSLGLADALERIIKDQALQRRLQDRARPSVVPVFDTERTSQTLEALLREAPR